MFSTSAFRALAIAAIALTVANAAPTTAVAAEAIKPDAALVDGHLFVCTDVNFTGACTNLGFNVGQCINFVAPFQDSITSLGPDAGFTCFAFVDINCAGSTLAVVSPGTPNVPGNFNDVLTSFRCSRN